MVCYSFRLNDFYEFCMPILKWCFPDCTLERVCLLIQETQEVRQVPSLVWKIPWRRKWRPTPKFLAGKFHGQRSLVGYSSWDCKESDETGHTHTHIEMILFPFISIEKIILKFCFICYLVRFW